MIPTCGQNRLVRRQLDKKFEDPPPVPPIPNVATYHPGTYKEQVESHFRSFNPDHRFNKILKPSYKL